MEKLVKLINEILPQTEFSISPLCKSMSAQDIKDHYHRNSEDSHSIIRQAAPLPTKENLNLISSELKTFLSPYIDPATGEIKTGLSYFANMEPMPEYAIDNLSLGLLRAASTLGTDRAVGIFQGWIAGEPFHYQYCALLTGIGLEPGQILELKTGIEIEGLEANIEYDKSVRMFRHENLSVGYAKLSFNCTAAPVFFSPLSNNVDFKKRWVGEKVVPEIDAEVFGDALALSYNHCVRFKMDWSDLGYLREFLLKGSESYRYKKAYAISEKPKSRNLTKKEFEMALEIYIDLIALKNKDNISSVIFRWINSKFTTQTISDQFIELRIVMESLFYIDTGNPSEYGFRIATNGSWFLGKNYNDRVRIFNTLRKAYSKASKSIHTGNIGATPENQNLLLEAQNICRKGILKRIKEGGSPDWRKVVLGGV